MPSRDCSLASRELPPKSSSLHCRPELWPVPWRVSLASALSLRRRLAVGRLASPSLLSVPECPIGVWGCLSSRTWTSPGAEGLPANPSLLQEFKNLKQECLPSKATFLLYLHGSNLLFLRLPRFLHLESSLVSLGKKRFPLTFPMR